MNGLQLTDTDENLEKENIILTARALIAKTIIFQKIFHLPRSRWTALKDLVINVPIQDDAINNTIIQLPRTLNEAGLIGIELKRKKEMKNTHKKQLISPVKIFKWITKLKESNNPYYLNVNSLEDFEKQDAVFIGSDCIDSYFDTLSAECSLSAL